jgi:hypothetical protein
MSEHIGDRLPPPLRFEFGTPSVGDTARALLLITVDDDACARVALLSPVQVGSGGERHVNLTVGSGSRTAQNLRSGRTAVLWCVLDAAAYSIALAPAAGAAQTQDGQERFDMSVRYVLRDFRPDAPLIAGPTYRALS